MRLGVMCNAENIPDWPLVEIQFKKAVMLRLDKARQLRANAQIINVHAPYYGTISSDKEQKTRDAMHRILEAVQVGHAIGSEIIVTHAGFYSKNMPEKTYGIVRKNYEKLIEQAGLIKIGVETMPRTSQFGSAKEVTRLAEDIGITPVFNLDSMQERGMGEKEVIDLVDSWDDAYCHFKNMKWKEKVDKTLIYEGELESLKSEQDFTTTKNFSNKIA